MQTIRYVTCRVWTLFGPLVGRNKTFCWTLLTTQQNVEIRFFESSMEPFISWTPRPIALYCGFLLQMGLPFFGNDFVTALLKNGSNERPYMHACTHNTQRREGSFLPFFQF